MAQIPGEQRLNFGPYHLQTWPRGSVFRPKFPISLRDQCLLDNIWRHSHNPKAFPEILQALALHLSGLNQEINDLKNQISNPKPIDLPEPSFRPKTIQSLEKQLQTLKVIINQKNLASELFKTEASRVAKQASLCLQLEKEKREQDWEQIPEQLDEVKFHLFKFVLADRMQEQLAIQEYFRRICRRPVQTHNGLTFSIMTYQNPQDTTKSFSFLNAIIQLGDWTDKKILGLDLSFQTLWDHGFVTRVFIPGVGYSAYKHFFKDRQLSLLCEKISESNGCSIMYIKMNVKAVPASFNPHYPGDCRREILVNTVHGIKPKIHYNSNGIVLVNEEVVPILEQIENYRALRGTHMEDSSYAFSSALIAENRNQKVFWQRFGHTIYIPFQSLFFEDPQLVAYYSQHQVLRKVKIYGEDPVVELYEYEEDEDALSDEHGNLANLLEF